MHVLITVPFLVLAACPALLAGQRADFGDWHHIDSTGTSTATHAPFAGTEGLDGAGEMRVACGDSGSPIVAFRHPPLGGTDPGAGVGFVLAPDPVRVWREGRLAADRRSTRLTHGTPDLVRLLALGHDSLRVRIETPDTEAGVDLVLSARGLREAVQRLPCVGPLSEFMAVRPQIANPRQAAEALAGFYPVQLRDRGLGDTVNVRILIDRNGQVVEAAIQEPSEHKDFNEAALGFVRVLRFTPAYNGPHRVPLWVSFDVTFEVGSRPWRSEPPGG